MKFCPYCGTALNDDMRFCPKCGNQYKEGEGQESEIQERQISSPLTPTTKKKPIWKIILIVLGVFVALWWFGIIEFDPNANNETYYKEGVSYYERGDYTKARDSFVRVDEEYEDTKLYNLLCLGHLSHHLTDEQIKELKRNLDFEDTKDLLLSDTQIAFSFLKGYWTSSDGKYYYEFYEQGDYIYVEYNLPSQQYNDDDGFYITEGLYGVKVKKTGDAKDIEKVDLFRITILGADKIAVVCLKDNSRIMMTR